MMFRSLVFSSKYNRGFSLIEVVITIAIISILTALVMVRYGAFNSAVLLKNQAFEIALGVREAQVFAVSVRSDTNEFREEYGVYFHRAPSFNQQYAFWQDSGSDNPPVYNTGEQIGDFVQLDGRFYVDNIYFNCTDDTFVTCTDGSSVSISFARPNFDAQIVRGNGVQVDTAHIVIASVDDPSFTRAIYITSTGLITVQ